VLDLFSSPAPFFTGADLLPAARPSDECGEGGEGRRGWGRTEGRRWRLEEGKHLYISSEQQLQNIRQSILQQLTCPFPKHYLYQYDSVTAVRAGLAAIAVQSDGSDLK
jgi:hypothetical protein